MKITATAKVSEVSAMRTVVQPDSFYTEEAMQYTRMMELYVYTMRMLGLAWNGFFLSGIGKILGVSVPTPDFSDNESGEFSLAQGHGGIMPSSASFDAAMQGSGGADKTHIPVLVGKHKKGFVWTLPIVMGTQGPTSDNMFSPYNLAKMFDVSWSAISSDPYSVRGFKLEQIEQMIRLLGDEFFDVEVPYTKRVTITPEHTLAELIAGSKLATINDAAKWNEEGLYAFHLDSVDMDEALAAYPEWLAKHFDGFMMQSAPLTKSNWGFIVSKDSPEGKTERVTITTLKEARALNDPAKLSEYITEVLQTRKKTVSARMLMPSIVAEYCTQRPANKIDVSHVGRYCVARYANEVLDFQYVDQYVNRQITDIRQLNISTPSSTPVRPGVDAKSGLGMTSRGFPVYIPVDMDTLDEYEEKQASIAKNDPNGFYYVWDALDIPGNMSLPTKPMSERPRPKLELDINTILYVDWRNRVLSYTDQQGSLRVEEIGDYRPINMRALKIYLEYPAFVALNRATTRQTRVGSLISYFLKHRLLKPLQSYVDKDEILEYLTVGDSELPGWVVDSYVDDLVRYLSRGDLVAASHADLSILNRRVKAVANNGEDFPDEESWLEEAYFDTRRGSDPHGILVRHITPRSPHILGRIVYRALNEAYKH